MAADPDSGVYPGVIACMAMTGLARDGSLGVNWAAVDMTAKAASAAPIETFESNRSGMRIAVVCAIYLVIVVVANTLPLVTPNTFMPQVTLVNQGYQLVLWLIWLAVLVESMVRQPSSPLWKLVFAYMALAQLWTLRYVGNPVVWSIGWATYPIQIAALVHLIVAFPSGHLRGRLDRAVVGAYYAYLIAISIAMSLIVRNVDLCQPTCHEQVFAAFADDGLAEWAGRANVIPPLVLAPGIFISLWRHWRYANPAARQVLAPVAVALPIVTVATALEYIGRNFWIEEISAFFESPLQPIPHLVMPIAFLIGVTRLRLNRTRVADLVVEFGRGIPIGGLRDALAQALGDPTLELAFTAPSGDGNVDASGRAVELPADTVGRAVTPLEWDGELLGVLIHDPAIEADDPGLVEAVSSAARLAIENERLAAQVRAQLEEVRASRARIVEAGDTERRRIERDLHDGAQQRLVALALRLQLAKETAAGAASLLDEATAEVQTAIGEVRDLARGLHPPILTEAGLRAAITALAERTPVPVTVDVPARRYPSTIETTAYFVVAEILTNVVRHARATDISVIATEAEGRLLVTIRDNGRGGADETRGSGLRGLRDRLAAVGGTLNINSPHDDGTTVTAAIPFT